MAPQPRGIRRARQTGSLRLRNGAHGRRDRIARTVLLERRYTPNDLYRRTPMTSPIAERRERLSPNRGPIAPAQLAHVVRRTVRFDELVEWYCTVLGAKVVHSNGMLAFL